MEASPAIQYALQVLYLVSIVLACGAVSGFIAKMIRVPDIVVFLLVGIVLGPAVSGVIGLPSDSALNQLILIFGAAYIIFDGGATVGLRVLKDVWISLVVIATIGVVITMLVVGYSAAWIFGIPLMVALLLGAIIASTDPATLVPVFKQVHIRDRVSHMVMSESALNDAMGAIITMVLLGLVMGSGAFSASDSLVNFIREAGLGIVVGAVVGGVAIVLVAHKRFNFLREYMAISTIAVVAGGYIIAAPIGASGYMAAFIAGLLFGNKEMFGFKVAPADDTDLEGFIGNSSLVMRMFIFILLGSQVDFELLSQYWLPALGLIAIFMFIARPLSVFLCCLPDRRAKWEFKELLFMCWVRETGVIPAALAGTAVGMGVPHGKLIASVVFMAILITIILQATTTKWWGAKLGLLVDDATE